MNCMGKITINTGNAAADSDKTRGWLVGHFIEQSVGLRHSNDVEIKWGIHKAGEARKEWVTGETRTAIAILMSGQSEMEFRDRTVQLSEPGDYVMWGEGTDHRWRIIQDAVVLTIRWPSLKKHNF